MKRTHLAILAAAVLATLFAQSAAAQDKNANLLVSRWAGPHADFQKQMVREFPDANVRIDDIDYGSLKQKQMTSFQAAKGTGNYDVVWVNIQWMKEYVDAGYLLPIDDLLKKYKVDTKHLREGHDAGRRHRRQDLRTADLRPVPDPGLRLRSLRRGQAQGAPDRGRFGGRGQVLQGDQGLGHRDPRQAGRSGGHTVLAAPLLVGRLLLRQAGQARPPVGSQRIRRERLRPAGPVLRPRSDRVAP